MFTPFDQQLNSIGSATHNAVNTVLQYRPSPQVSGTLGMLVLILGVWSIAYYLGTRRHPNVLRTKEAKREREAKRNDLLLRTTYAAVTELVAKEKINLTEAEEFFWKHKLKVQPLQEEKRNEMKERLNKKHGDKIVKLRPKKVGEFLRKA